MKLKFRILSAIILTVLVFTSLSYTSGVVEGQTPTSEVLLFEGWNFIGLPLVPEDPSIDIVLSEIIDNVEAVWTFDGYLKTWSSYSPRAPSDLTEMVEDKGYWIKMKTNVILTIYGCESESETLLLSYISYLEYRLETIMDINIKQYYTWEYLDVTWNWDITPIPISLYVDYYERSRPIYWSSWVDMAKDPDDDYYITKMIQQINSDSIKAGFTEIEKVNFVISFVQSLPYTVDSVTTPWDEYPRYPIETLFDRGGDCEDTSILVAALLDRLGYDVCLIFLEDDNHAATGISIEGGYGTYYIHEGVEYFYLETTGEGWQIGEKPSSLISTSAYIYPLNP
ncbi:hypothetical protein ES703_119364 [subsurface metagenome]